MVPLALPLHVTLPSYSSPPQSSIHKTLKLCKFRLKQSSANNATSHSFNDYLDSKNRTRVSTVNCNLNSSSLVSPDDHWGLWTALFATGAAGLWSEKTKIGSTISAALVSILLGLAASNVGIIPHDAPAYGVVFRYLLPLTIPLLLFRADLRQVVRSTGTLFLAFLLGSVATTVGTLVAFALVPMRSLGQDSWKIASALMGSYIGGAINYIAISEALSVSPSVIAAGVAADNVITALYFILLFALASKLPQEASSPTETASLCPVLNQTTLIVPESAAAIGVSFAICKVATSLANRFRVEGGDLTIITAIIVSLATVFPSYFRHLAPAGDTFALVLMQVFFAVLGASGSLWNVINTAPSIFLFALVQVAVHLLVILSLGRLFRIDQRQLLIASNANIGGPTTACAMATAKGWSGLVVPGILVGIFGISIATFLGIGFGSLVLRHM